MGVWSTYGDAVHPETSRVIGELLQPNLKWVVEERLSTDHYIMVGVGEWQNGGSV